MKLSRRTALPDAAGAISASLVRSFGGETKIEHARRHALRQSPVSQGFAGHDYLPARDPFAFLCETAERCDPV